MASRNKMAIDLYGTLEKLTGEGASDAEIAKAVREAFGVETPKTAPKEEKPAKKKAGKKKAPKSEE